MKSKFYALAIQFEDVAANDGTVAIVNLLTCSNPQGRPSLHAWADQIHVWTGMAWQKYFYNSDIKTWSKDGASDATTDSVKAGDTVFFVRSSRGAAGDTITLSGGVHLATAPMSIDVVKSKYYFVSYPWPVAFGVASFKECLSNPIGRPSLHAWADQVHRWTGMAWSKYYYNSDLKGFVKDGESSITTDKLEPGEGCFFVRSARGVDGDTLTFTKPEGL